MTEVRSTKPEHILEIGPGIGALTEDLQKLNIPLQLIEMDKKFTAFWQQKGFSVIEGDALRISWGEIVKNPTLLVSNLPFQIAGRLLIDRSQGPDLVKTMILMFQKEVALRIVAQPNSEDYGFLSVMAQIHWNIRLIVEAGSVDFYPKPRVASRVMRFDRKPAASKDSRISGFVKSAFAQRRKMLTKNLQAKWPTDVVRQALGKLGKGEKVRAQELKPQEFIDLFYLLHPS